MITKTNLLVMEAVGSLAFAVIAGACQSTPAEPELALRHGAVMAPRLVRAGAGAGALAAPAAAPDYRVAVTDPGRLDGVRLVAAPELSEPLAPGQVRVRVRAAGMNSAPFTPASSFATKAS